MWMGDIDAKLHAKTEDLHSYGLKACQSVNSGAIKHHSILCSGPTQNIYMTDHFIRSF
jgi:hypothetical protein